MPISLGDVKNKGVKVKRINEEDEKINDTTISNNIVGQTINLRDIKNGKARIKPIIEPTVKTSNNYGAFGTAVANIPNIKEALTTTPIEPTIETKQQATQNTKEIKKAETNLKEKEKAYQQAKEKYSSKVAQELEKNNVGTQFEIKNDRFNAPLTYETKEIQNKIEQDKKTIDSTAMEKVNKSVEKEREEINKNSQKKQLPTITDVLKSNISFPKKLAYINQRLNNSIKASELIGTKTIAKEGENTLDTLNNLSGKANALALNLIGQKELAKQEQENKRKFVEQNLTEDLAEKTNLNNRLASAESNSFVTSDNAGGKLVQGVSQMLPRIALSYALGVPGYAGASTKGLTGLAKAGQIAKNIGTATLVNTPSNIAMAGSVYGNSLEQAYNEGATEEQATKYAIGNTAIEIATEWITGGIPGTNGVGGLDILANKSIDKISNNLTKELVKYGYKMVGEGAEEGLAEILNPLLKNATYSKGNKINWNEVIESAIYGGLTAGILELPTTVGNLSLSRNNSQNITNNQPMTIANQNNQQAIESNPFAEFGKKIEQEQLNSQPFYQQIKSTDSVQRQKIYKQINESNILNNSKDSHNLVDFMAKMSEYTKHDYILTNNQQLQSKYSNLPSDVVINGYMENGTIFANVESKDPIKNVIGHETTHLFEDTKTYQQLQNTVFELAKEKGEFEQKLAETTKNYEGVDADINKELTADLVGDYLFTNQEFINRIHTENRNIFQKAYDFIKHLYNMATAGSKEQRLLEKAMYMFDKANSQSLEQSRSQSIDGIMYNIGNKLQGEGGYDGQSMSNRARLAYTNGEMPLSKWTKSAIIDEISSQIDSDIDLSKLTLKELRDNFLTQSSWHHTGAFYNETNFYSIDESAIENLNNETIEEIINDREYKRKDRVSNEDKNFILKQEKLLKESNPDASVFHTYKGIRLFENTLKDSEYRSWKSKGITEDFTSDMIQKALNTGKVTIYYDTDNLDIGNYVSTSKQKIENFNYNNHKIFSKEVNLKDIAWSDPINGYYLDTSNQGVDNTSFSSSKDNQGRTLSKAQQEFFKDSKIRDDKGNLLTVYHGTRNDFTVFDTNKSGQSNGMESTVGFWFTENNRGAKQFADNVWYGDNDKAKTMEVYLDIKNPKIYESVDNSKKIDNIKIEQKEINSKLKKYYDKYGVTFDIITQQPEQNTFNDIARYNYSDSDFKQVIKEWAKPKNVNEYLKDIKDYQELNKRSKVLENQLSDLRYTDSYEQFRNDIYAIDGKSPTDANMGGTGMALNNESEVMRQYITNLKKQGYDGLIIKGTDYDSNIFGKKNNQYVAFYSNQIKNVDNMNPTINDDIRLSLSKNVENDNGIEYNNQGIQLEKSEYARVMSAIHNKQTKNLKHIGENFIYFGNNIYIFKENGFDNVIIKAKANIENNMEFINSIEEVMSDGTIQKSKNFDTIIREFYTRQRTNNNSNDNVKTGKSSNSYDRMVNRQISKKTEIRNITNNEQNNRNNGTNYATEYSKFPIADVENQNNSSLKNAPIVDTFMGAPVYKKANNVETFFTKDTKTSDETFNETFNPTEEQRVKKQDRYNTFKDKFVLTTLEDSSIKKIQDTGLDVKYGDLVLDDKVSENLLKNNFSANEIYKIPGFIEFGKMSQISNDIIKVTARDGQFDYTVDIKSNNGVLSIENLSKKSTNHMIKLSIDKTDNNNQNINEHTTSDEIKDMVSQDKGKSKFYKNVTEKSKFITDENREKLSKEDDIKFYNKVTNEESMNSAMERLDRGGDSEILNWIKNDKKNIDSTDIAEGWILLKRYQDVNDYDSMVQVAKKMREMGTKSGQAVQMYNLLARLTPEGMVKYAQSELSEAYEIQVKGKSREWINKNRDSFELTPDETKFIVDTMKKVETMKDGYDKKVELAKIQSMLQNKLPPSQGAGIKAWMRISMLFNPKTQIRNIAGNAVIAPVNALADTFSSLIDKQIAKKTGVRTTGNTNLKNYAKGFKQGLYQSYNDFKQDINTRNIQGNRFEIGQGKSFKERTVIGKMLNRTDKMLSFVLDAGDRGFYEASFTNSINNQLVLNNTTKVTQEMIDIATNEALSRTWQDNNNYTRFVLNVRSGLNKINVKGYGLGDVLIPFAKTPANLTKAIVDYSPVGFAKTLLVDAKKINNSLENGQYSAKIQHQFVQNLGKATAGSLLYVLGYALAKAGNTKGQSDDDKDVRDFMKNTLGISSYSIKIGNKTFTYDWAQPVAAPFAMMADLINKKNDEASLLEKVTSTLNTGLNLILQQSFMSSIQDVLTDYDGVASGIINQILDLPARAVPTFLKQVNDMIDSTQRTSFEKDKPIESAINSVKAKIPILSKDLAASRDTLGREIKKYGGENNPFNVFLNPANMNKGKSSDSAKEIYKVYEATGDKTIFPRVAPYTLTATVDKKKISKQLSSKERSEFQKISGEIIEENVKKLSSNNYYKKLSDDNKAEVIYSIVGYAYNKAKSEILDIEIANKYKKIDKKLKYNTVSLYDYYARQTYQNRNK